MYFPYIRLVQHVRMWFLPPEYKHPKGFLWEKYLEETGTQAAPARAFKPVRMSHRQVLTSGIEAVLENVLI